MKPTIAIAFLGIILITSCQRELFFDKEPITPIIPDDGTSLSKMIVLDTTKPRGADTIFTAQYSYDNLKRSVHFLGIDRIKQEKLEATLHYNGTDSFPDNTVSTRTNLLNNTVIETHTIYYRFSANGWFLSDSATASPQGATIPMAHYYSYSSDTINVQTQVYHPSGRQTSTEKIKASRTNNNITTQSGSDANGQYQYNLNWDDHPNAFSRLVSPRFRNMATTPVFFGTGGVTPMQLVLEINNPTEIKLSFPSSPASNRWDIYRYAYHVNTGLPAIIWWQDALHPEKHSKTMMYYTKF